MAWNEPGSGNKQNGDEQGPPDLDKAFKELSQKFSGLFGKKKSGNSQGSGSNDTVNMKPLLLVGFIVLIVIWIISGIFIVSPAEESVILQFGRYQSTVGPGPHWIPRFIRSETTLNVQKINNYSYSAQMLTKDQNIVDVSVAVQYQISDARDFLFNLVNPTNSVQQATASALRQVIGNTTLDQVLTSGRAVVRQNVMTQLNKVLSLYHAGIRITDVALQPAKAPAEVKDAFDDAIKAQEDEQRYQNQAQAYQNSVLPIAKGKAQRIAEEAIAYAQQTVLQAQAAVVQFNAVYSVYRNAPAVTRERMYLTAIEKVLKNTTKVFVDTKGNNNNLMYLPINKLIAKAEKSDAQSNADSDSVTTQELERSGVLSDNSDDTSTVRPGGSYVNPDSTVGQGARP